MSNVKIRNAFKHGMSNTKTYQSWAMAKQRCLNKNCKDYKNYGGREITVCDEWLGKNGFKNFYRDMGNCPENKTLDRIDNDKNYCKKNCKYSTQEEQHNNTSRNHLLTYKKKTQTLAQWAKELKMNRKTLDTRIRRGWSIEKALNN